MCRSSAERPSVGREPSSEALIEVPERLSTGPLPSNSRADGLTRSLWASGPRAAVYARVSTLDQNVDNQLEELRR